MTTTTVRAREGKLLHEEAMTASRPLHALFVAVVHGIHGSSDYVLHED